MKDHWDGCNFLKHSNFFDDISKGLDGLKDVYFNLKNDDVYHEANFFEVLKVEPQPIGKIEK